MTVITLHISEAAKQIIAFIRVRPCVGRVCVSLSDCLRKKR